MKASNAQKETHLKTGDSTIATQEEISHFLDRLMTDLDAGNFFRSEDLRPTMERNITNIFTRNELTEQEVRTLQGILSALRGNKKTHQ